MQNLNYGAIGNGRSAALISRTGSIDWLCLPEFDSPFIFGRLLDIEKGGYFAIETDNNYTISQSYLNRTNILCTQFQSKHGAFEIIDFMPRYKTSDGDYYTSAEIFRYIRYVSGQPQIIVKYYPVFNYASEEVAHTFQDNYIRSYSKNNPRNCVYLYSDLNFNQLLAEHPITISKNCFLMLSYNQKLIDIDINRVYLEYQRTKVYWLNWTNRCKKYKLYTEEIIRSLLVLKTMSFEQSGAVLAALTTSLPETIGEVRNWDYRFCWLRDASMSIETLLKMGHYNAAKRFLVFIKNILKSKSDTFQIMYGIRGERDLTEYELPQLAGYENSKPVRIGNAAFHQQQNDIFGYIQNVILQYYRFFPGTLDEIEDMWEIVRNISRTVEARWAIADKGIWEFRNNDKHFVFSKIMCWVAMDRAAQIADLLYKPFYKKKWASIAEEIKADVLKNGWKDDIQSFSQTYCNNELDASLLLMEPYGFVEASDPLYIKTVEAVQKALLRDGLMYRYTNNDDFGKPKSAFTICTFWLTDALFKIGKQEEAKEIFDNLLTYSNHLGLFSEDIDFESRQLLGNFPQAYSHLALINTAILFSEEQKISRFIKP